MHNTHRHNILWRLQRCECDGVCVPMFGRWANRWEWRQILEYNNNNRWSHISRDSKRNTMISIRLYSITYTGSERRHQSGLGGGQHHSLERTHQWTCNHLPIQSDTPYEGGLYQIDIVIPPEYPYKPPKVISFTRRWNSKPKYGTRTSHRKQEPSAWTFSRISGPQHSPSGQPCSLSKPSFALLSPTTLRMLWWQDNTNQIRKHISNTPRNGSRSMPLPKSTKPRYRD